MEVGFLEPHCAGILFVYPVGHYIFLLHFFAHAWNHWVINWLLFGFMGAIKEKKVRSQDLNFLILSYILAYFVPLILTLTLTPILVSAPLVIQVNSIEDLVTVAYRCLWFSSWSSKSCSYFFNLTIY